MAPANGYTRDQIFAIVRDTLTAVAPDAGPVADDTRLLGSQAAIDSVGFVTLLVSLEQNLDNAVDLSASFMAQGDIDEGRNPFRTVGALTAHVHDLLTTSA
jgi:hypothetical protein